MKTLQALLLLVLFCLGLQQCESVQVGGPAPVKTDTTNYACAGKTTCPEMKSCVEAEFYLKNCPNTVLDGDLDGIPCEDQLCGH